MFGESSRKRKNYCLNNIVKNSLIYYPYKYIVNREIFATQEFDGTKQSFEIALGNLSYSNRLREYGLMNKISYILKSLYQLYEEASIRITSDLVISHGETVLIMISNNSVNKEDTNEVLYLDICR